MNKRMALATAIVLSIAACDPVGQAHRPAPSRRRRRRSPRQPEMPP